MPTGPLFILGAYLTFSIMQYCDNFWTAMLLAPIAVGLFGMAVEYLLLRHLYKGTMYTRFC